jgi:integrase/recombinase XerD
VNIALDRKPARAAHGLHFGNPDTAKLRASHAKIAQPECQAKNEHRNPIDVDIPVHPDLQRSLDAAPSGHLTFLVTEFGKPHSPNGFGNKFKDWCREAGLPHCSAHGLRKAAAARLAERGATAHEIMAITGHQSLEEVERYTRAAQRRTLADSAMAKLKR